jgi:hypothetical protein
MRGFQKPISSEGWLLLFLNFLADDGILTAWGSGVMYPEGLHVKLQHPITPIPYKRRRYAKGTGVSKVFKASLSSTFPAYHLFGMLAAIDPPQSVLVDANP